MTGRIKVASLFLKPGEIVVSAHPVAVTTLLGSCVAVTMFSPRHRTGAICHGLLPNCRKDPECCDGGSGGGKYIECAIRLMLKGLTECGVLRGDIIAKVFGGSDMFETEGRNRSVGRQNIDMALSLLEKESIRVVTQDLGGQRGRKIVFHTYSGEVFLKRLKKTEV
jgi:chemotaxis protein CheD